MDEYSAADVHIGTVGRGGHDGAPAQTNLRDILSDNEKQAGALGEMLKELEGRMFGFQPEAAEAPGNAAILNPAVVATAVRVSSALRGCYATVESLLART